MLFGLHETAESTNEETCLGNRDYDSVLSMIDNDVFASEQCLLMETIMMKYNGSIGTKQSRISLMEQRLNSYGDKRLFPQAGYHSQQAVISKNAFTVNVFQILPVFQEFTGKKPL